MDREQQQCPLRIREPYQRRIWWVWSPLNTKAPELTGNMAHRSIQEDLRQKKKNWEAGERQGHVENSLGNGAGAPSFQSEQLQQQAEAKG